MFLEKITISKSSQPPLSNLEDVPRRLPTLSSTSSMTADQQITSRQGDGRNDVPSARPPDVQLPFPLGQGVDAPSLVLVARGAEALLYRTIYLLPSIPCALKYRPSKAYRHPTLDARLTRHRVLSEARVLVKCQRAGVPVPAVYQLDWERGWLMMEWIVGSNVKDVFIDRSRCLRHRSDGHDEVLRQDEVVRDLMVKVGTAVGRLHAAGVVHGDLTTSNMMLRMASSDETSATSVTMGLATLRPSGTTSTGDIVLIDFGLAVQTLQDEDRAVDLYVLERAFGSTHPNLEGVFQDVLDAYGTSFSGATQVLKRLEDVRLRGRKKSMLG